ncbi:Integral membrane protein TerC family protein [compost metagenome]
MVLGLLISVPIMVLGSTLILKWVERYPVIIYIGAGVLAWTAAKMISNEPLIQEYLLEHRLIEWLLYGLIVGGVILSGWLRDAPIKSTRGEATPKHT